MPMLSSVLWATSGSRSAIRISVALAVDAAPVEVLASFAPGTDDAFAPVNSSSLITSSAWRGSASSSMPVSVALTTLLRILSSEDFSAPRPSISTLSLYMF